jgi:hypothetical protein
MKLENVQIEIKSKEHYEAVKKDCRDWENEDINT